MGRPKKKVDVIEKVAPHTIKKCELIEHYVDEWARKILGFNGVNGRDGSKGIIYIDCMQEIFPRKFVHHTACAVPWESRYLNRRMDI